MIEITVPVMNLAVLTIKAILAAVLLSAVIFYGFKVFDKEKKFTTYRKYAIKAAVAFIAVFMFIVPLVTGVYSPKMEIPKLTKQSQIEYDAKKDVEIVTPPQRTKTLDGFTVDKKF